MDFSPYVPKNLPSSLPHWGGATPESVGNKVNGAIDQYGNQAYDTVKGYRDQANKKLIEALPYLAVGGTVLSALWGQDNDKLWGTQAEANDAADAGVKAEPPSER